MKFRVAVVIPALVASFVFMTSAARTVAVRSHDSEAKLLSELERETNPIKKAKLEIRLGRLKLKEAFAAYSTGKYDACWKLLAAYQSAMERAWADLQSSGRNAAKRPDGFKQLDIGLRESRRDMEDFETHITYEERQAVEKIRIQTENLHNRVLTSLFPAMAPKKNERGQPGPSRSDSLHKGDRN
jgi:hypothetical protein